MRDSRMDHALKKGDQLHCKEGTYEIIGLIGSGGMSLVYEAVLNGGKLSCALKEYYPYGQGMMRTNGVIALTEQQQSMAMHEMEMSQQASRNTRRVAPSKKVEPFEMVVDGVRYQPDRQGVFMVQEHLGHGICFDAMVQHMIMDGQRFPHIFDTLSLIQQVLLALKQCHENGVWFGDVHPGNVIFCGVDHQHVKYGEGVLIDFGASRQLDADGKTEPINGICVASDYAAPELYEPNARPGPEADIYSVGVLLQRCIMDSEELEAGGSSPVVLGSFYENRGRQLGCRNNSRTLYELINKATAQDPKDRYANADVMLQALGELMKKVTPPNHILPNNLSAPEYFQPGNRLELIENARQELLQKGEEPLILHGLGGIGKTETAIQLGLSLMRQDYREVYLIHWQESTRCTIESLFADQEAAAEQHNLLGRRYARKNTDHLFERNFNILAQEYKGSVLILDNFYRDGKSLDDLRNEDAFQHLLGLCPSISIVLTTRYDTGKPQWKIEQLSVDDLLELMRHFMPYQWERENKADLRALICKVERHTLTVTLIAKTLEAMEGDLTAAQLLEVFGTNTLAVTEMDAVATEQNRTYTQDRIYGHLKKLFDYSGLSAEQLQMMAIACILPEGGMDRDLLKGCLPKELNDARKTLMRRGWLEHRGEKIAVHPLVAQICREIEEIPIVYDFLKILMSKWDFDQFQHTQYQQLAQTSANASEHLYPLAAIYASTMYNILGDSKRALHYSQKALEITESNQRLIYPIYPKAYTDCLCNLSNAQRNNGSAKEAFTTAYRALEYHKRNASRDSFPYEIYEQLIMSCLDMANVDMAFPYIAEMKRYLKTNSAVDDVTKTKCYVVFGNVELYHKKEGKALKHFLAAEQLYNKLPQKEMHIAINANISGGIGHCYCESKPKIALKYFEQCRDILKKWYKDYPHPDLVNVYGEIAGMYFILNDFPAAEENLRAAITVMEPIVGQGHSALCTEYYVLSAACEKQGKHTEQLKYLKLAIEAGSVESVADLIAQSNTPKEINEVMEYLKRLRAKGIDTTMWEMSLRFKSGGRI